ncbi:Serine/threonine-protein kinase HT1 [Leucoagaricus sp. SymC.cos]|nr:Serine/threonine-protein kinase HT1 [Leucoagaricus sp. SymC.cos]
MWETTDDSDFTSESEQALKQGWHHMLEHGAPIVKFENNRSSAWKVLGPLIAKELHARLVRSHQEYEIKNQSLRNSGGVGRQGIEGFSRDIKAYRCRVDKTLRELGEGKVELEPLQILLGSLPNGVEKSGVAAPLAKAPIGGFWKNLGGLILKPVPTRDMQQYESLSRVMILDILQDNEAIGRIPCAFCHSDAQLMADFLNKTMLDQTIATVDRMRLFSMLCKLSTFANVLPSLYRVENISVDEKTPIVAEHGHSKTYKVVNRGTAFRCKTSRPPGTNDEQMNSFLHKMHIKETVLWAHLSHPNIEPFSGFLANKGPEAETIYTLSPWMKNGNIRTYAGSVPYNARLPLIADIAEGLYYLHGLGLLHGNLKGNNILISNDERAVITGFGLGNFVDNPVILNGERSMITPRWTAPELFPGYGNNASHEGPLRPTQSSDIWSFGCVIYEVTTLRDPYFHLKKHQLFTALANSEHPQRLRDENQCQPDDDIWRVITTFMNFDPEKRPDSQNAKNIIIQGLRFRDRREGGAGSTDSTSVSLYAKSKSTVDIDYNGMHKLLLDIMTAPPDSEDNTPPPDIDVVSVAQDEES